MTDRSEQKLRTRLKLIEVALKLSAEKGFGSISLREVTKEAGISPAAFYRHFHDMDELGLVLIEEVGLGLRQLLRDARRRIDKGGSAVRASVETFIQYMTENANLFRVLQGERQGASSAFRKALFIELGRFIDDVSDELERGFEKSGQSVEDISLAAEAVVAIVFTVGAEALDLPKHKRLELTERIIREVRMVLRGVLAKKVKQN